MIISNSAAAFLGNNQSSLPQTQGSFYAPNHLQATNLSTLNANPFQRDALLTTATATNPNNHSLQHSVVLCSREDESRFLKDMEQKNRVERLKLVREQEKLATRQMLQSQQIKNQQEQERLQEQQRYEEYLLKKQEIERLRQLREIEIERQGKAMRDAEEAEERRLREELERKDKAIKDEAARRGRGKQALDKERKLMEEKKEIEEAIKQIERKRMVATQEQAIAREAAQKYREQQSTIEDSKSINHSRLTGAVAAEVSTLRTASHVDYTNTRFHNALVVKHSEDSAFVQSELEKLKKGAFDKAKEEQTKKSIMKAQKENQNRVNTQKALERGKKALNEVASKRDKEVFEKEMRKLHIQEGLQKISEGKIVPGEETGAQTVYQERKEKQKQQKMLKLFEEEVIVQPDKKQQSRSRERNNNQAVIMRGDNINNIGLKIQIAEPQQLDPSPTELQRQQELQQQAMEIVRQREQNYRQQPSIGSSYQLDNVRTYNGPNMGLSSQSLINQSAQQQPHSSGTYVIQNNNNNTSSEFTQDFNHRAQHYYSPTSQPDQQHTQQPYPVSSPSQHLPSPPPVIIHNQQQYNPPQYQSNETSLEGNPFFVPPPSNQPRIAPPLSNALPQYFNPYLMQHQQQMQVLDQDEGIKISIKHPKEQISNNNVEEFLQDNREYLESNRDKQGNQMEEDSEMPDEEYDDEDDSSSMSDQNQDDGRGVLSQSSSSMSSVQESPSQSQDKSIAGAYRMEEIDRIIREAREQKKRMLQPHNEEQLDDQLSSSSSEGVSESFDEKYLQKYSALSQSNIQQNKAQPYSSNLADEFLNDDQPASNITQAQLQHLSALRHQQESLNQQLSYLKSKPQQQQPAVFDYTQKPHYQRITTINHDNTPMSELSYSYSEMPHGAFGASQYGPNGGSTLNQSRGYTNAAPPYQRTIEESIPQQRGIHTGGVKIEISADVSSSSSIEANQKSLADIFREKRGLQKMNQEETKKEPAQKQRVEKTKEELAEIRRQMMKQRPSANNTSQSSQSQPSLDKSQRQPDSSLDLSKQQLMQRLARGEKAEVSKRDMLKLTLKNYEQLPEVRKKKEADKKKEEIKERMKQVKELERQRREQMRPGSAKQR